MAFTLESAREVFLGTQESSVIPATIERFNALNLEDQLALFWFAYTEVGQSITPVALGVAKMELVAGLLNDIKEMSASGQTQAMFDLANHADTPISRSYGFFSVNTKLGFWYQLGEWMKEGLIAPIPPGYQMSEEASSLLEAIKKLDGGQQITVLRGIVVDMGYDPAQAVSRPSKPVEFKFVRSETVDQLTVEGITEPAVLNYFKAMNQDQFEAAIALFEPNGALQPPFQEPIVGREAILAYMNEEAQGLNMMPTQGLVQALEDGSKQIKITGKVQTPWFGVNVGMNIAWRFVLNPQGQIFFVAIDMLASPEELVSLRPEKRIK